MPGIDQYTKLMLHCNGADEATTFIDSATGKAVTAVETAQIDTTQYKFGGASLLVDGNSDYLTLIDSADWNFANGNFTIDCWLRFNTIEITQHFCGGYIDDNNRWFLGMDGDTTTVYFFVVLASSAIININGAWSPSANTWYHLAVVRGWSGNANDYAITVNGSSVATGTDDSTFPDYASLFAVGTGGATGGFVSYFDGWIDEFRVSKGIARWTANFTSPVSAYIRGGNSLPFFM